MQVASSVSQAWTDALLHACAELAQRSDLDQNAHVNVDAVPGGALALRVTLPDGRTAVRNVDSADGLMLTLAALLVLPTATETPSSEKPAAQEQSDPSAEPTKPAAGRASHEANASQTNAPERSEPALPPYSEPLALHLGLSASVLGHVMGIPTYVAAGLAVAVSVRFGPMLLSVSPRWEAEQASLRMRLPDFEMRCVGVAGFLGLRIWNDVAGAAETGAGVLVLAETQSYRENGVELIGTVVSGQLAMFARLLWGEQPSLRWSIGVEASLVPRRFSHETHVHEILPPLPALGVGINFGAHWES